MSQVIIERIDENYIVGRRGYDTIFFHQPTGNVRIAGISTGVPSIQ